MAKGLRRLTPLRPSPTSFSSGHAGRPRQFLSITDADARATPDRRYYASKDDRMEIHRTSLVLTHKVRFSPKLEMTTDVYRHDPTAPGAR